jgi:hypothetical protein
VDETSIGCEAAANEGPWRYGGENNQKIFSFLIEDVRINEA